MPGAISLSKGLHVRRGAGAGVAVGGSMPVSPRTRGVSLIPASAYWPRAHRLAILLIAIIAVRLHELLPFLRPLKPALTVAVVGLVFLFRHTKPRAVNALLASRTFLLVLAYMIWACFTVPFALWIGLAVESAFVFLPALFLLISIMLCPPTLRSLGLLQAGFVGAAAVSAVALFAIGSGERLELAGSYDSNDTAALMALSLPFALGLVFHARGRDRMIGLAAAALLAAAVIGTGSRGGTLALITGVLVFVLGLRGTRKFGMLAAAAVGAVVLWNFAPPDFREKMTALARGEEDYNETEYDGRKQIWARSMIYIKDSPLIGVGIGNFPVAEGDYLAAQGRRGKWSVTHNSYLQATSELGIPGGILFTSLLILALRRAFPYWRMKGWGKAARERHRPELLASITAFAVSSFFLSHAYYFVFFALMGFVDLAARALRASAEPGGAPVVLQGLPPRRGVFRGRSRPGQYPGEFPPELGGQSP